ncbi:hypothetical protein BDF14DRAFT_1837334 [Spinellus fusiger]|nr:hypothetical protein BDF14DRAFT_1837334 [Spinellus fusiger]
MTIMEPSSLLCTPLRSVWKVQGNPTETLWWPAKNPTKGQKTVLFFVPGNPGLVEYYTRFLEEIYSSSECHLEIYGVSHLGHSTGQHTRLPHTHNKNKFYSLQDQIDHKAACFDAIRAMNSSETRYIFIAHSVGSYICAEVLKMRQTEGIHRLIALFPTLREIALTPNGVSMVRIGAVIPNCLVSTAATLASWMPAPIRHGLTALATGQREPSLSVTAHQLMSGSIVGNILHMAFEEMDTIKALDHDFYDAHVDKFVMYYSKNDHWAPLEHYDYMKEKFPKAQVYLCQENIPHAFIFEEKHSSYMAQKVVAWIEDRY